MLESVKSVPWFKLPTWLHLPEPAVLWFEALRKNPVEKPPELICSLNTGSSEVAADWMGFDSLEFQFLFLEGKSRNWKCTKRRNLNAIPSSRD